MFVLPERNVDVNTVGINLIRCLRSVRSLMRCDVSLERVIIVTRLVFVFLSLFIPFEEWHDLTSTTIAQNLRFECVSCRFFSPLDRVKLSVKFASPVVGCLAV